MEENYDLEKQGVIENYDDIVKEIDGFRKRAAVLFTLFPDLHFWNAVASVFRGDKFFRCLRNTFSILYGPARSEISRLLADLYCEYYVNDGDISQRSIERLNEMFGGSI